MSFQASAFICFESTEFKGQEVCYATNPENDLVAKKYFIELTKKISNPGTLASLRGEMAKLYTTKRFHSSLIKHYSHITPESIEQIISQDELSAVFLKSGEIMYFDHALSSFIFDFDSPLLFVGASRLYNKGSKPKTKALPSNKSNCVLQKEGVVFLSPSQESFFFSEASTFCTYGGFYFENKGNSITIRPVSSIGKRGYSISGASIEFKKFIKWLQLP